MTHKTGIIGLGMIGASMLQEFLTHPAFSVAAVWDLNDTINKHIANRFPDVTIADDATAIIQHPDIDLVYIATPPVTHIDYANKVLAANKALLCDKPLAINLDKARKLVDKAEASGIATAMNFVYGAGSVVETIEQQLSEGAIGTPQSIEVRYQFPSWPLPNQLSAASWIVMRDQGGMIREMFSHFVYLIQRLFGSITIHSTILDYSDEENASEQFVLAHLTTGDLPIWLMGGVGSKAAPRESELTIHGTEGSLRLSSLYDVAISTDGAWRNLPPAAGTPPLAQARLSALARRLQGEPTSLPDLRAGFEVQQVIEKMLT